jgi:hypothetical protein
MEKTKKLIELGILPEMEESGVQKISLVEHPAIEVNFMYFKKEEFVEPLSGEHQDEFIPRCVAYNVNEGKDPDQAAAICYSVWRETHAAVYPQAEEHKDDYLKRCINVYVNDKEVSPSDANEICHFLWNERFDVAKISYDYDDTLSTATGQVAALASMNAGYQVWVISARSDREGMFPLTDSLGIPRDRVLATGSNEAKVAKIMELGITTHIDNNQEVIDQLGEIGQKFDIGTGSLPSYVDEVPKDRKDQVETPQPTWSWGPKFSAEFLEMLATIGSELGFSEEEVDLVETSHFADQNAIKDSNSNFAKDEEEEFLWKYKSSRVTGSSRDFCSTMINLNRYYSREEITLLNSLNSEFGPGGDSSYSIFLYKGGANCQHYWQKYSAKREKGRIKISPISINGTYEERMAATAIRTQTGRGYLKSPESTLPGLSGHSEFGAVKMLAFEEEGEQKVLVGPAMVPDIKIVRADENGKPYDVTFSEETVAEIARKYMKEARTNDVNKDHKANDAGTYVFESWIIEDPKTDKANTVYGFSLPKGTWMVKMKVDDPETWRRVKTGELRGLSVEGLFSDLEEIKELKRYMKIKNILKNK